MSKRLRFSKIQLKERAGALMLVRFLDDEGNMYDWCPKWGEIDKIFWSQIDVERFNKPESEWLGHFTDRHQEALKRVQEVKSAEKVHGKFARFEEQKLVIQYQEKRRVITDMSFNLFSRGQEGAEHRLVTVERKLSPGFVITSSFLDKWLGRDVEVFIINGIAFQIREYGDWGGIIEEYPESE